MKSILFSFCCLTFLTCAYAQNKTIVPANDRKLWLNYLDKLAKPILSNLAQDKLKEIMPVILSPTIDNKETRSQVAYLEAFGRVLSGIAPWLNGEGGSAEEIAMRNQYRQWSLQALANAVNPSAKDYLRWNGGQPLVDASFLALALVRCPWLWAHTPNNIREQVVTAFKTTRATVPSYSNWLLFSAMIEVFLCKYDYQEFDPVRIDYAIKEFSQHWYVGDGVYSDGMQYHWDYYNSYVIQPYMSAIMEVMNEQKKSFVSYAPRFAKITQRYAEIQERLINTDGTFPATGRSIVYRGGAFQHLADMSLRKQLPSSLKPAQVRSALTAVLKKTSEAPSTFTKDGWLNIGLYGNQPDIADRYITTGSLYLCATILLPLGLPDTDEFWTSPPEPWTAVKVWSGQSVAPDHALD